MAVSCFEGFYLSFKILYFFENFRSGHGLLKRENYKMSSLIYPKERTLEKITLVLGIVFWLLLLVGTFGVALLVLLVGYIFYLFAQSALISYIKGNGVLLTSRQFPDLHQQFAECCATLKMEPWPEVYILHGNGAMNAFATRFLGAQHVVLLSDVVDAMSANPDGVRFYLGHEIGHLHMRHLGKMFLRWPALWLPLLGAAYSRARETSCDRYGLACCSSPDNAGRALAALAAGHKRWRDLDLEQFCLQVRETSGFWMSLHELTGGYPWLTKRVARVTSREALIPARSKFSYLLALCVPYAGRSGGLFALIIYIYILFFAFAFGLPFLKDVTARFEAIKMVNETAVARNALTNAYFNNRQPPASLASLGVPTGLPNGDRLLYNQQNMTLVINSGGKSIRLICPCLTRTRSSGAVLLWKV